MNKKGINDSDSDDKTGELFAYARDVCGEKVFHDQDKILLAAADYNLAHDCYSCIDYPSPFFFVFTGFKAYNV